MNLDMLEIMQTLSNVDNEVSHKRLNESLILTEKAPSKVDTKYTTSPTPEMYNKIEMWHNGQRRENIKACGDSKLLTYYNICKEKGYTEQQEQIKQELDKRNIQIQFIKKLQNQLVKKTQIPRF